MQATCLAIYIPILLKHLRAGAPYLYSTEVALSEVNILTKVGDYPTYIQHQAVATAEQLKIVSLFMYYYNSWLACYPPPHLTNLYTTCVYTISLSSKRWPNNYGPIMTLPLLVASY